MPQDPTAGKIFKAHTYEEAVKQAAEYFQTGAENLEISKLSQAKGLGFLRNLARPSAVEIEAKPKIPGAAASQIPDASPSPAEEETTPPAAALNGSYKLDFLPEGVYLSVFAPEEGGAPLNLYDLMNYLKKINLLNFKMLEVKNAVQNTLENILIAPPQERRIIGEEALVEVAKD